MFLVEITEQTGLQDNHSVGLVTPLLVTNPALSSAHPDDKAPLLNSEIQTHLPGVASDVQAQQDVIMVL